MSDDVAETCERWRKLRVAGILLGTDIGEKILHETLILFDYRNAVVQYKLPMPK